MTPERFRQAREIFQQALDIDPERRSAFLDRGCEGDGSLRAEVESLLASASEASGSLMEAVHSELKIIADDTPTLPRRIGPYTLRSEIGRGGMGAVYLAERSDREFEGRVAVKLVKRGMDTDFILERFRSERQILASLSHAGIARLLDGGTTADGMPYFVMEYVEGKHLLEYADERRLPLSERIALFRSVCDAVSYAHRNLVVHRDLKPGNILVTADGTAKLLDFGLAKLLDPAGEPGEAASTLAAQRMLTPGYASPEQIRGDRVTTASDVFSLGVVLYRLLAGNGPFTGRTAEEVSRAVLEQPPKSTRKILGEDLDTILSKALRKEPARRYASVDQLSEDLRRYIEGRPVLARKDTLSYRARRFVTRHRFGVAAAVLVALLLAATTGTALWQARRAMQKEALALKRFEDLRRLAHTVMFELHDGIQTLPGSTPARALLVRTALRYLNGLALDAGSDPELLLELADAYERIGDVQGGTNPGNLGDTGGALRSYRTALRIRESLVALSGSLDDRSRLAESLARSSRALARSGGLRAALADARRCALIREELLALEPGVIRRMKDLAAASHTLGDALWEEGDLDAAVESFTKETALQESVLIREPVPNHRWNVAVAHFKLGSALAGIGKPAVALPHLEKAATMSGELLHGEPGNAMHQRIVTFTLGALADALYETGRTGPAFETFVRALSLREAIVSADPANANQEMHLGILYGRYGNLLAREGRRAQGLSMGRKGITILERLSAADPQNVDAAYETAEAVRRLAQSCEPRAGARPGKVTSSSWAEAGALYRRSLDALLALRARGALAGLHSAEPRELAAELARCEAEGSGGPGRHRVAREHLSPAGSRALPPRSSRPPSSRPRPNHR